MCTDEEAAGIFISGDPVDPLKRGSEPSWRLCFLGAEISVGALRIRSVRWEPAGVLAPGSRQWQGVWEMTDSACRNYHKILLPEAKGPSSFLLLL